MDNIAKISLDQIDTSGRIRTFSPEQVEAIKDSINSVGLLNPITVTQADTGFKLVAGGNRLEACRQLGYHEVDAIVRDLTEFEAILAECDENLCGTKLTPAERATFTVRRKEAYEALHPETRHGGDRKSDQVANFATRSFVEDQAAKTGMAPRTIRLDAERGERVAQEALDRIRGTKLDSGAYLDRIKTLKPDEQVQVVERDLSAPRPAPRNAAPEPKKLPTYEEMRAAIYLLGELSVGDFISLCPAQKRAAMCQRLAQLQATFEAVREEAVR